MKVPMGPPPPKSLPEPQPEPESTSDPTPIIEDEPIPNPSEPNQPAPAIPYAIPPWSEPPGHPFLLEVLKDGAIVDQLHVSEKGAYMFGRVDLCDFVLEHPTISRFHAVLQFKKGGEAFLYDLGSTHGTFVNKGQVKKKEYTKVRVGDVIRFGHSSRLYIFQGPSELMPPEGDLGKLRKVNLIREEMIDREASLARARVEASLADGISWGMTEDAIEEDTENGADEVTWQTYKGQLTERQEKTRGKIIKRLEKVSNMKKEIDAIRAKDIAQGGLTQGQQTQIARNEQRMSQIMEELESLEETLNESIQESLGARSGKGVLGRKKGNIDEEDAIMSDDDDFFDRTKKPSAKKSGEQQSVETADSLLDKKEAIINEMEEKKALLLKEKDKVMPPAGSSSEGGDDLDAYMAGLSSQMVLDKIVRMEKELSDLKSEFDRLTYLLKIADPMGEAAKRREAKSEMPKLKQPILDIPKHPQSKQKKHITAEKCVSISSPEGTPHSAEKLASPEKGKDVCENEERKAAAYTVAKPQWLGAIDDMKSEEDRTQAAHIDATESDNFVDYKDRKKVLAQENEGQELEHAAPGLIIRKRKPLDDPGETIDKVSKSASSSADAESTAADAVALLLKHNRGYVAFEDEVGDGSQQSHTRSHSDKGNSRPKRVLGPSRPDFLEKNQDYETWVPPKGQTGDGRTSLNDRLGY